MTNKHKSSIEYLAHELNSLSMDYLTGQITNKEHNERYDRIIEKANVMFKHEIRSSFYEGRYEYNNYDSSEHYYNETFGDNHNS